jgi:DNA-binding transcriptional regulator LsrR (DeoR family)
LVARAAASYLERWLEDGMTVAVGMGRNTGELPEYFHPARKIGCTFAAAMGSSPHVAHSINPNNIADRLAANCSGESMHLLAPAYVENQQIRDLLISQEAVGPTIRRAMRADIALVGVGAPTDDATLVRMECLSLAESRQLQENGAVGDILGVYFDEQGQTVPSNLHNRLVGLSLYDLRHIDTVVALVSERQKARAILGALRTGVIQVLITDVENGREVLRLAESPAAPEGRVTSGV